MDNASKALIMAGAILISIAIVGVGVYIYSTVSGTADSVGSSMGAIEANQMNAQLATYANKRVKGSTVLSFMELVTTYNTNKAFPKDVEAKTGSLAASDISNNQYYEIELSDTNSDGYYDQYNVESYTAGATPTATGTGT